MRLLKNSDMELKDTSLISSPNLKGYYRFNSGALTTDSSGQSNTLTNNNTVGEIAGGKWGYAADFGASNTSKYFSLGNDYGLNGQTVSISLWFKMANPSDNVEFFGIFDNTTNTQFYGGYNGTNLSLVRDRVGVGTNIISVAKTLDTGWHHYVGTLSNGGSGGPLELFFDRVSQGTDSVPSGNGSVGQSDEFRIGRGPGSAYMKGLIDDLGVLNKVLSQAEINELFNTPGGFFSLL